MADESIDLRQILRSRGITDQNLEEPIQPRRRRDRDGLYKRRDYWHYELVIDGKKRSFTTGTKDYSQAKKIRAAAVRELEQGKLPVESGRKRFEEAAAEYIKHREATAAVGTVRLEKERLGPLKRGIGNRALKEITARVIRDYQAARAKDVSGRTVNMEIQLLRSILKAEGQWKRLEEDVKPLPENSESPGRALTPEETLTLFAVAESKEAWLAAYLAATVANDTGMRGVELRNLRLGSIDVDKRTITVQRRATKTTGGVRTIHLTNDSLKAVVRLLERTQMLGASESDHFLFPARVKGGYDPRKPTRGWRSAWRSLRKAAHLGKFRFHDLRHTFITTHAEIGTPLPVVEAQAGHLSAEMTKLYIHISQKSMQKAAAEFEKAKAARLEEARKAQKLEAVN